MKPSVGRLSIRPSVRPAAGAVIVALIAATLWLNRTRLTALRPPVIHLHAPDLALVAQAGPAIQIHLLAMLAALGLGAALMIGVKGRRTHRILGWAFAVIMMAGVLASFFVRTLIPGSFSPIHLLSAYTLVVLPLAVMAARRHDVAQHRKRMTTIFYFGLLIAGLFTFVPGRLMWRLFFG
jgi:uncharacterized membrane protein